MDLALSNLRKAAPVLALYRRYRKKMYKQPVAVDSPFALSVSPAEGRDEQVVGLLREMNIQKTLVRIPSWQMRGLDRLEKIISLLHSEEREITAALLQNREDILYPRRWQHFVEEVFSRFKRFCSFFEIGHAWNRTKWGIWDHQEYLTLARPALSLAEKYEVKLVGPAVIDFEFHVYPPVLKNIPFDKVSSLLYVDRVGAPERRQFGWDTSRKLALLKAVVDGGAGKEQDLWITEVNWPLRGTGKYSPASGKPNVSEEEQADYLVRYYLFCAASGLVERIYWWQLVAPGYGLVDSRQKDWRRRPGFSAMKNMVSQLEGSTFLKKIPHPGGEFFAFRKQEKDFLVCWTSGEPFYHDLGREVAQVISRDGEEVSFTGSMLRIEPSPKYVFLE